MTLFSLEEEKKKKLFLSSNIEEIYPYRYIWPLAVPLKIKILSWLAFLNKLHAKERLIYKGVYNVDIL